MITINSSTKSQLIITAIAIIPIYYMGAYFSNVHAGPGIEILFWFGVFLLLPVYALGSFGIISDPLGFVVVIVILEPLWVFLLVKGAYAIWKPVKKS